MDPTIGETHFSLCTRLAIMAHNAGRKEIEETTVMWPDILALEG